MGCFQAVRTKLCHPIYKQTCKPVNHGVLKTCNFFGKAQNRVINQQDTQTWISFVFEKSRIFNFPIFVSIYRFLGTFQIFFRSFCERAVVSYIFLWNFAREIDAHPARNDPLAHAWRLTACAGLQSLEALQLQKKTLRSLAKRKIQQLLYIL